MEPYLAWAILGLALAIVEVFTGTFYLLMLGVAAGSIAGLLFNFLANKYLVYRPRNAD